MIFSDIIMNRWVSVLGSVLFISLLSLVGIFALTDRGLYHLNRKLTYLISLAAGIMLGAAVFHILPEASETMGIGKTFSIVFGASFVFFFTLEKLLLFHHHHHADENDLPTVSEKPAAIHAGNKTIVRPFVWINLFGGMIHNLIDGVTIAVTFLLNPSLGLTTVIATMLHEIPREIGDFAVLIHGGLPVKRALLLNLSTGLVSILGALAVLLIGTHLKGYTQWLLPVAAANFLYIALANLLPELSHIRSRSQSLKQILLIVFGMWLMFILKQELK